MTGEKKRLYIFTREDSFQLLNIMRKNEWNPQIEHGASGQLWETIFEEWWEWWHSTHAHVLRANEINPDKHAIPTRNSLRNRWNNMKRKAIQARARVLERGDAAKEVNLFFFKKMQSILSLVTYLVSSKSVIKLSNF